MAPSSQASRAQTQYSAATRPASENRADDTRCFGAGSGPRRGEGVGLKWTDLDLDAGTIEISEQIVQLGWETETTTPKSDSEGTGVLDSLIVVVLGPIRARASSSGTAQVEQRLRQREARTVHHSGRSENLPDDQSEYSSSDPLSDRCAMPSVVPSVHSSQAPRRST